MHWVFTVQDYPITDVTEPWVLCGIICADEPLHNAYRQPTCFGWGAARDVWTEGTLHWDEGGWEEWREGDEAVFRFDPLTRELTMFHKRRAMSFSLSSLPDLPFRLLMCFEPDIAHVCVREATLEDLEFAGFAAA
jgi:hypothetical protein